MTETMGWLRIALPLRRKRCCVHRLPLQAEAQLKCQHDYHEPASGPGTHDSEPTLLTATREGTCGCAPWPHTYTAHLKPDPQGEVSEVMQRMFHSRVDGDFADHFPAAYPFNQCSSSVSARRIGQSAARPCPGHAAISVARPSRTRSSEAMRARTSRNLA